MHFYRTLNLRRSAFALGFQGPRVQVKLTTNNSHAFLIGLDYKLQVL